MIKILEYFIEFKERSYSANKYKLFNFDTFTSKSTIFLKQEYFCSQ